MAKKKTKSTSFFDLPHTEQLMCVRILHTGQLTTEEIAKKLSIEQKFVAAMLEELHLKPNQGRAVEDDGYHVRVTI